MCRRSGGVQKSAHPRIPKALQKWTGAGWLTHSTLSVAPKCSETYDLISSVVNISTPRRCTLVGTRTVSLLSVVDVAALAPVSLGSGGGAVI